MRILGLDPGTKRTGYAVIDGLDAADLVDVGVETYSAAWLREHVGELVRSGYPKLARLFRTRDVAAWVRMCVIGADALNLIEEYRPTAIAIEVSDGRAGTGSRHGASGALSSYGMSVGWLSGIAWMIKNHSVLRGWDPPLPVPAPVRIWTRGMTKKEHRKALFAAMYPSEYWAKIDKGGDARDAIGIARFAWDVLDGKTKLRG